MYDILVIGCGIVGAATAYELSRYQLKTAVVEQYNDVANGCTKANSAILHAGFDCPPGSLEARLNLEGIRLAKILCKNLDVARREVPTFVIAFNKREMDAVQMLFSRGLKNGVPGIRILEKEKALALEPALNPNLIGALYAPESAIVDPWQYCLALAETAVRNGVTLYRSCRVTAIEREPDGHFIVTAGTRRFESRFIINAAGGFSADVYGMVGGHLHQTNYAGEYFVLDKSQSSLLHSIVFPCPDEHGFKGILVAPTVHGNLIVGPDCYHVSDGTAVGTDPIALPLLKAQGLHSVPGIDFSQIIHEYAGVRPNTEVPDFVIGEAPECPGFVNLAGIKSPGLSSAPAIAKEAVRLLAQGGIALVKKTDFCCHRHRVVFSRLSEAEQSALIHRDPHYGRLVCRCEKVTEGELLAALHSPIPPTTIDGLKRRCGAGLGRCQGGFCMPRVHTLLAQELGVPMEQILMDEAGSWILSGSLRCDTENTGQMKSKNCAQHQAGSPALLAQDKSVKAVRAHFGAEPSPCLFGSPKGKQKVESFDIIVVGAGPAGLAAALSAREHGTDRILLLDREDSAGGILNQCIHSGFGLQRFGEELTGPEYADRFLEQVAAAGLILRTGTSVLRLTPAGVQGGLHEIAAASSSHGFETFFSRCVILATGCRERTRGAIALPGDRPAGIFTAGQAQRYLNLDGYLVGRRAVILGSGDIGLIMARRLTLAGAKVLACVELQPEPGGLARNLQQCLNDFEIPLLLSHTITRVTGKHRVESVSIAKVGKDRLPLPGTEQTIACDTLLLSVGLIPENELAREAGIPIDPATGGPIVFETGETLIPGIFSCGNSRAVYDLADSVTLQSERAGAAAARFSTAPPIRPFFSLTAGKGIRSLFPQRVHTDLSACEIFFRAAQSFSNCLVSLWAGTECLFSVPQPRLSPCTLDRITLPAEVLRKAADHALCLCVEERESSS